jgi:4-amino-4-deoxy-L-arabinose transferase-like glycosyltransferase
MPAVRRRLLNLLTALSLLLCVAVCVLWVRSYRVADGFARTQPSESHSVESGSGEIVWTHTVWGDIDRTFLEPPQFGVWRYVSSDAEPFPTLSSRIGEEGTPPGWLNVGGFVFGRHTSGPDLPYSVLAVPYWAVFLPLAIPSALLLLRRIRRRVAPGHCPSCGYDLRATPGRCPECGHQPGPVGKLSEV